MRAAPGAIEQMSMRESCLRPPRRRPAQREAVGRQWHGGCVPAAPELAPVGRRMRRTHQPSLCSQMGNAMRAERSPTFMRAGEWADSSAHNRIPALCAQRAISRSINRGTAQSWFVQRPRTAARSSCFRVNPPPPLSPPVCSWRGEYVCSMYGVPSPRTSSSKKIPNDECAPWASTPRSTFLSTDSSSRNGTADQAQPQRVDWADDEEPMLTVAPLQDRLVTSSHRGVASRAVVRNR